jgi:hypothetical protein
MHFNSMKELLTDLRSFMKDNPSAYLSIKDNPNELRVGFEAITDDTTKCWTCALSKVKNDDGAFSNDEKKIVQEFFDARVAYNVAMGKYLRLISGQEPNEVVITSDMLGKIEEIVSKLEQLGLTKETESKLE